MAPHATAEPPNANGESSTMPLASVDTTGPYYDIGNHTHPITTTSPDAQLWFDRGLTWAYSFNHQEAEQCFKRAVACDPDCPMAYWGLAYAIGPNYNKAWRFFDPQDLQDTIRRANEALAHAANICDSATPIEKALIKALGALFPPLGTLEPDYAALNRAYADAMRPVYKAHGEDLDVAALFTDALMCMTPRGLWDLNTGKVTGPHTTEAQNVIETAFKTLAGRNHLALCHLQIHLLEMSPYSASVLPAADRLRMMAPHASHILHMPTHIDAAVGDWRRAIDSNNLAIAADDKYFSSNTGSIFYTLYRIHYICAKLYAAMMSGRYEDAVSAAEKVNQVITPELLAMKSPPMASWIESFLGSEAHVLIRFGRWDDILRLELPADRELYCATYATILYARGIAFSALGWIEESEAAEKDFNAARALVPETRLNSIPATQNSVHAVASGMLAGELAYRRGNFDEAFATLRHAAQLEDDLAYSDPPPWMQPVRHALGGLLLEQGRVEEAEQAFKEDLGFAKGYPKRKAKPNNVWGLHGLNECLRRAGKEKEKMIVAAALEVALASADVEVGASCYCRLDRGGEEECC